MNRSVSSALAAVVAVGPAAAQLQWQTPAATGAPPAFCGHAWDSARGRLVAFGGLVGVSTLRNTTLEWTGSQWITVTPATSPSARSRVAMAFDAARGVTLMFGGNLGPAGFSDQTWSWNGTNWSQQSPATVPPPRFAAAMAYDSWRQVVVLHGGFVPAGTDTADLWEWNGSTWSQPAVSGLAPSARGAHRMAFDAVRGVALIHGGYSTPALTTLADSWTWNGSSWTQLPAGPGSLCDEVLVYDAARERVVLFGGLNVVPGQFTDLSQTWEWAGAAWQLRSTTATPSARSSAANGYDTVNRRVLVGGGTNSFGIQATNTVALVPTQPATTSVFGSGCDSSSGPMQIEAVSLPYIGSGFEQRVTGVPVVSPLVEIAIGFSNTNWNGTALPLDLSGTGAVGCTLYISLDMEAYVVPDFGTATLTLPVPNLATILGLAVFVQAGAIDPFSTRPFPVALTAPRSYTIGSP